MNSKWFHVSMLAISLLLIAPLHSLQAQPVISTQPQDTTIPFGEDATFTAEATGTPPLTYQWRDYVNQVEFTDIPDATNATLVLSSPGPTFHRFRVVVSNVDGETFSRLARLTVLVLVTITEQPLSQTLEVSQNLTLSVTAGSPTTPITYQWRFNEADLPGETSTNLVINDIQLSQAGNYDVVITNPAGTVTSDTAVITVIPALLERIRTGPGAGAGGDRPGAWADYDNDGFVDLFVKSSNGQNLLFQNNGDGLFTRILTGPLVSTTGNGTAVWADYDNDGNLDIFMSFGNNGTVALYRNLGGGEFAPVNAGDATTTIGPTRGCSWTDYDNDGDLDLIRAIASYQPDMLFQNNGDGTLTRIRDSGPGSTTGWYSHGVSWFDYDNDGAPDIFINDADGQGLYWNNLGNGSFAFANYKDTRFLVRTFFLGLVWGDYDNDGNLDAFAANHGGVSTVSYPNILLRNKGDGSFERVVDLALSRNTGQSSSASWADYDNDGWLDLFVANGGWFTGDFPENNFLFHNNGDGTFTEVTGRAVTKDGGRSHGGSWADYDNDGFLDLFVANDQPETDFLYHNTGNSNAWLLLKLRGTASNRSAIGAKIHLQATIHGEELRQTRVVFGGSSIIGQDDFRVHFGLGDATQADVIKIEWPSGTVQELTNVMARQILDITEIIPLQITITQQPESTIAEEGKLTKLFAKVSGPQPLTFQWQKDGADLPGKIHRILALNNPQVSDAGNYRLRISAEGLDPVLTEEISLTVVQPALPGAHRLTGITRTSDGTIQVSLAGDEPPGLHDIFGIEVTGDFSNWTALPFLSSPSGVASLEEDPSTGQGGRFFRAFQEGFWTPYPAPTGPHRVGIQRRQLQDSTREGTRGPIVISLWYPAPPGPAAPPAPWLDQDIIPRLAELMNPALSMLSRVHSHAAFGLPAAETALGWPVILYSQGYWGLRSENTDLMTELASHGYIAIAVDHIDARITSLEDGSLVETRGGFDGLTLQDRVSDIQFLMDELAQWNMDDPLLASRVDMSRIATIGHSFGGETSLVVGRIDDRCKAVVGLDSGFYGGSISSAGFDKPAFHFLGGPWNVLNDPVRVFYNQTPGPAYFVQVQGSIHGSFSSSVSCVAPEVPEAIIDNLRMNRILRTYTLSFLNKHLRGMDDGLLDGPSEDFPEMDPFLSK